MNNFFVIPALEVQKYNDGWWVVEEFEDCGRYTYKKRIGPFDEEEDAQAAASRR